jgi:hypothetical protein
MSNLLMLVTLTPTQDAAVACAWMVLAVMAKGMALDCLGGIA